MTISVSDINHLIHPVDDLEVVHLPEIDVDGDDVAGGGAVGIQRGRQLLHGGARGRHHARVHRHFRLLASGRRKFTCKDRRRCESFKNILVTNRISMLRRVVTPATSPLCPYPLWEETRSFRDI